jgi:hypothetical protein
MGHKPPPSLHSLSQNITALHEVLNEEQDFVCVLIVGGYLDRCLEAMLPRHLLPGSTSTRLLSSRGILGTFQARTDLCYCLRLISPEAKKNLDQIAEIRNKFGHAHEVIGFDDEEIASLCAKLRFPKVNQSVVLGGGPDPKGPFADVQHPRSRFSVVASLLISEILVSCHGMDMREPVPNAGGKRNT